MNDAYTLLIYREGGHWNPLFTGKLWECQNQAARPDDGMPWKIIDRTGRIVERSHNKASVVEFA